MVVRFLFVNDLLSILFTIAWWPSAGKELSSWLSALAVLVLKCISDLVSRAGCEIRLYRFLIVNTCCLVILRSMDLFAIGEARIAVQDRHMTPESRFRSFKRNGAYNHRL